VLPVAIAGLLTFGGNGNADLYMLSLPLAGQMPVMTLITFIGGFSAATAMVIVASVALSIMVSNDIVMPIFLRRNLRAAAASARFRQDIAQHPAQRDLRRAAARLRLLPLDRQHAGLASIGLLSFAAIAQMAPALFGGLIWRRANARGAILGLTSAFVIWIYLLFLPSSAVRTIPHVASAVLGFLFPGTTIFSAARRRSAGQCDGAEPARQHRLLHRLADPQCQSRWSASRPASSSSGKSRSQKATAAGRPGSASGSEDDDLALSRRRADAALVPDLPAEVRPQAGGRPAGRHGADPFLRTAARQRHRLVVGPAGAVADPAEGRGCLSDTAWLLDQASEALQYNQDMLQTALSQMDQGIAVFDSSNHLTIWNRRFRQLLDLPETAGQVGFPLSDIVAILSQRGDVRRRRQPDWCGIS
jgi:PAS domain-containing protein